MNKIGPILGLILGLASIFGAFVMEGGSINTLFLVGPIMIVFGGTFAAVIIGFGFEKFKKIFTLMKIAYFSQEYNLRKLINNLVEFSIISRREGLLSLEKRLETLDYLFPRKLIRFTIDGSDSSSLMEIARTEMKMMQERHSSYQFIFIKMGGYAPTMGILGTVMGLFLTLTNADANPDLLIKNIATAFIATLWGVFSANMIWLPIGDKLKECHLKEKHMMEISLEAALSLQGGEIPSLTKARLVSMLPQSEQKDMIDI